MRRLAARRKSRARKKTVSQNGRPGIGRVIGTKTEPILCDTEK
jgi:hypothetical protein